MGSAERGGRGGAPFGRFAEISSFPAKYFCCWMYRKNEEGMDEGVHHQAVLSAVSVMSSSTATIRVPEQADVLHTCEG